MAASTNLKSDLTTLSEVREVLRRLSLHIEQRTLDALYSKYWKIVTAYEKKQTENKLLHHCAGELKVIDEFIRNRKYGEAKLKLQEDIKMAISALSAETQ